MLLKTSIVVYGVLLATLAYGFGLVARDLRRFFESNDVTVVVLSLGGLDAIDICKTAGRLRCCRLGIYLRLERCNN